MTITADAVIEAYVNTRNEIKRKEKALDAELEPLKALQEKREQWLLNEIQKTGLKNLPTKHGTAYVTRQESLTCGDWDAFLGYIKKEEKWELLEHRVAKTAALEIMGEERENPPPPGVNYTACNKIGVRKS